MAEPAQEDSFGAHADRDLLDFTARDVIEQLASADAAPGGGTAAALAVAMAAGVTEMAAVRSRERWGDADGAIGEARALRARVAPMAQADAQAYEEARRALAGVPGEEAENRDRDLGRALDFAASVPLAIAEAGSEVASLAAFVSEKGDPNVRGDAAAAALLAEAGARAAANLVEINLATTEKDARLERARELAASASEAAKRAVAESR